MGKVQIAKQRKQITYADHWHTSNVLLKQGIEERKGSYHLFLSSIVFTAFALEAFLNHVGEKLFSSWEDLEKLSPRGKLNIVCEKLHIKIDYGTTPWQIVPELFGIRNKIAHGKTSLLKEGRTVPHDDTYEKIMHKFLLSDWQEYSTKENAEKARSEIEKIIRGIWEKAKIEREILFDIGGQSWEARFIDD